MNEDTVGTIRAVLICLGCAWLSVRWGCNPLAVFDLVVGALWAGWGLRGVR